MQYLKQSTAKTIIFGPFVDKTDGVTLKTDATTITDIDHATTGIFLSKAGATAAVRHATVTASVADAYGMMKVTLDTTDTDTVGMLDVLFAKAATYLPVHKSFMVLPANVYDALMGADLLDVNAAQINGTAQTAGDVVADVAAVHVHVDDIHGTDLPAVKADTAALITQVGDVHATDLPALKTVVDDLHNTDIPAIKTVIDDIHGTDLPAVKSDTAAILLDTGTDGVVLKAAGLNADAVTKINEGAAILSGTCQAGSTYNNIILAASGPSAVNDFYVGCLVTIVGGTGMGQARLIADYIGASKTAVVDNPWITAPAADSQYRIYPFSGILLADTGMVTAASPTTITLASSAPAIADTYIGHTIFISGGTGIGQARIITAYTNTRICTVRTWEITPDTSSVYMILPVGRVYVNEMGDGVIKASTFTAGALDAGALAADAVDEILDEVIEGTTTLRQAMRILLSALAAKSSGGGTATLVFRDIGDTKPRITATVDANGNRTAIVRDGT